MPQDAKTDSGLLDTLATSSTSDAVAEAYADNLMEELFDDVDRILDGGIQLPTEPVAPEYVSLQSVSIPHITLSPKQGDLTTDDNIDALVQSAAETQSVQQLNRNFDRLLMGAAGGALVLTLGFWGWNQMNGDRGLQFADQPSSEVLQAQADAHFLAYMQRSLSVIDRNSDADQLAAAKTPGSASSQSPASQNSTPNVLERVYIPVYQPPQNLSPSQLPPVPSATASAPGQPTAATATSSAAKPSTAKPAASRPAQPAAPKAPPKPPQPAVVHVLVGILELGDNSAALFEVDGTSRRVGLGETIGASGWTLVSVANQEAVMRRNGEVRSIYVGQKF